MDISRSNLAACAINRIGLSVSDPYPKNTEPVLMLHGWPFSSEMYKGQMGVLGECGFRPIAFDFPGFGDSPIKSQPLDYNSLADSVHTVVRFLGLSSFSLVGFSMGGAVALRYMSRFCGYGVKKLFLLAAAAPWFPQTPEIPYGFTEKEVAAMAGQARDDPDRLSFSVSRKMFVPESADAKGMDWLKSMADRANPRAMREAALALRDETALRDAWSVRVPTLLIHGMEDQIVPFEAGEYLRNQIPNSRLYSLTPCGHAMFYEQREMFNCQLIKFLTS